jgi:hypothetical protein
MLPEKENPLSKGERVGVIRQNWSRYTAPRPGRLAWQFRFMAKCMCMVTEEL